jgi:hypothetical protein
LKNIVKLVVVILIFLAVNIFIYSANSLPHASALPEGPWPGKYDVQVRDGAMAAAYYDNMTVIGVTDGYLICRNKSGTFAFKAPTTICTPVRYGYSNQ